jgi:S1-C subfamily serine protease
MSLPETFERVRSGLVHIIFVNERGDIVAKGTGFICSGLMITNNHVFAGPRNSIVCLRKEGQSKAEAFCLPYADFAQRLKTGSQENCYDYAILDIPEIVGADDHQFSLENPRTRRIGEAIALIGFPLEHMNLTCHAGIISSFYESGPASIVQVDASVNSGNSGGPLIDPNTGSVLGIVTRKGTGLSKLFQNLRDALKSNIKFIEEQTSGVGMFIGSYNPIEGAIVGQHQILRLLDEIERQANVGIGYAISAEHLLAEPIFQEFK